ncbi:Protein of unknown function [Enhydrobacter aerosaccus]|uniref:DUF4239 domain-containing protein n=1 Tax=Enhydrobacter aerosaccus TaxID=225324 RepID=A0A1T4N0G5_9HYPH|nr:DUF4239 domain-containing protein [Enhydrobacter aerosaccus]SJZ72621.1 Protein of unknown function [Enhydrobacter aerosaccus]
MFGPAFAALLTFAVLLAGATFGVVLRRCLPDHMLDQDAKDVVRLGMGLIATIAALVLSLLISSSNGLYEAQRSELRNIAGDLIFLDDILRLYGDDTRPARLLLRQSIPTMVEHIWSSPDEIDGAPAPLQRNPQAEAAYASIVGLATHSESQSLLKAQALQVVARISQARYQLYERSKARLPSLLIIILVSWMVFLFVSFCLFSPLKHTSTVALAVIALSASTAVFLILELAQPFGGIMRVSEHPLTTALGPL